MSVVLAQETYRIELPIFEGPFDLLLFFIERDELDIHDIPISQITRDFLLYIREMEEMNIEIAAEFILVASSLMRIKAKMLLPRPVLDEEGNVQDPRQELVERLIEYKRFKAIQEDLRELEEAASERFKRAFVKAEEKRLLSEDKPEDEMSGLDLYALMRTFKRLMEKHHDRMARPKHVIRRYPYRVEDIKAKLLKRLETKKRLDFVSYVLDEPNKVFLVFSFLSILELAQQQKLKLIIGKGFNNFWICHPSYKTK